jgi:FMN phosphatase YigB (HAD superfamily)
MKNTENLNNKKIIVFDLGGVILKFSHLSICEKLSNISNTPVNEIYEFIFKSDLESKYEIGAITSSDFYNKIIDFLKIIISFNGFYDIWTNIFEENFETSKIITELKEQKYRMVLLSNTNEMHFNFVKSKFAIVNVFDAYILSYKAGCIKPDISIFKEVLRTTGVDPIGHIYIDDIMENVIAAKSVGMIGIHFKNAGKLKKDLADYF